MLDKSVSTVKNDDESDFVIEQLEQGELVNREIQMDMDGNAMPKYAHYNNV